MIEDYASDKSLFMLIYYPDYNSFGKSAPLKRNHLIVEASDCLIAFWDGVSKGTKYTIDLANNKGIPVRIVKI